MRPNTPWEVVYYLSPTGSNPVKDFIISLPKVPRAKIRRIFMLAEIYGVELIYPYVRKMSGVPLWELRILGKDSIRILYVTEVNQVIIALHGFIKKSQKTPPREIEVALERLKMWKEHHNQY